MWPRASHRSIPRLLRDTPDFRRLWCGQTISVFGDQVTQLGLPLVAVLTLGADATQMGTLTAVGLFPHLLFSLPAGSGSIASGRAAGRWSQRTSGGPC